MVQEKIEAKINRTTRRLAELSLRQQRLAQEYQKLLKDLNLSPDELKESADGMGKFSAEIQEDLLRERKKIEDNLNFKLTNIRNPNATKKTYSERATIQSHWLFVR